MNGPGSSQQEELLALLSAYCDGTIAGVKSERLEALLRSDDDARHLYVEYLFLHQSLRSLEAGSAWPVAGAFAPPPATGIPTAGAQPAASAPPLLRAIRMLPGGEFTVGVLVVLAVVTAYATLLSYRHGTAERERLLSAAGELAATLQASSAREPVGEISSAESGSISIDNVDVRKPTAAMAKAGLIAIPIGADHRLRVLRGLTQLRMRNGVALTVEGPSELEPSRDGNIWLRSGQLVALVPPGSRGFTVQTPQAAVIDLGTEFSVRAADGNQTEINVLQGEVSVVPGERGKASFDVTHAVQLRAGEALRVDASGRTIRLSQREWAAAQGLQPKTTLGRLPSYLDLADVVAGGDGRGTHRGGIDPRSGQFVTTHPAENDYASDGQYHRVQDNRGIDGVFIPDTTKGPVQLDSAGHLFDGFGTTDGRSWNFIWGGGALPAVIWGNSTVLDIDYAADGHSLIGFHANKGITFDLEAMSAQLDGLEVARFITQIGNPSRPAGSANNNAAGDIWIFVDGQLRASKRQIYTGNYHLEVPLRPTNRFLTIVCTDGGDTYDGDRFILGDPQILLQPATKNTPESFGGKDMAAEK